MCLEGGASGCEMRWMSRIGVRVTIRMSKPTVEISPGHLTASQYSMSPGPPPTSPPYTQPYSSYPQPFNQYSTQQYPAVNYASQPQGTVYSTFQVPYGRKASSSWVDSLPPQDLSCVDPEIASKSMNRFISTELKYEGFDAAEPAALSRLEAEVVNCTFHIHKLSHYS